MKLSLYWLYWLSLQYDSSSQKKLEILIQYDTLIRGLSKTSRQTVLGQFNNPSSATIRTNLKSSWPVHPEPSGQRMESFNVSVVRRRGKENILETFIGIKL